MLTKDPSAPLPVFGKQPPKPSLVAATQPPKPSLVAATQPPEPSPLRRRRAIRLWMHPHSAGSPWRRWVLYAIGGLLGAGLLLNPVIGFVMFVIASPFACFFFLAEQTSLNGRRLPKSSRLPFFLRRWSMLRRPGACTCPYCHDGLDEEAADCCDGCGTGYHAECRQELLGSCGTLGCPHQGRRAAVCKLGC